MKDMSQLDIMTVLYFYAKSYHVYIIRLESDFFHGELETFFEYFQSYYKKYGKVPPKIYFENEVDESEKAEILGLYEKLFVNVENVKFLAQDFIIDKLNNFAKKNFLKRFLVESYDSFEQGKYDTIINNVSDLVGSMIDNDLGQEYHSDDFFVKRYESELTGDYVPTGFMQFDQTFDGWHNKSLNIIAGPANSGKTMWLVNVVVKRLLDDKKRNNKILYITLEIDGNQVGRRIDSCITGVPVKELWNKRDMGVRELIALSKDTHGNRVMIKEMQGYTSTPADIDACIRNLQILGNGECSPTMVIVDYLGLLYPNHFTKTMNTYEKGLNIAVELRSLAQKYNIPFIVAAQTNRDSFDGRAGMDKISDSIGISQTADLMITINRNETLDQNNQVEGYLAKSRFSRNGITYVFDVDYTTMQLSDITLSIKRDEEDFQ